MYVLFLPVFVSLRFLFFLFLVPFASFYMFAIMWFKADVGGTGWLVAWLGWEGVMMFGTALA